MQDTTTRLDFFELSAEALLSKAQAHLSKNEHYEAKTYLNALLKKAPENGEYYYSRAICFTKLKQYKAALADFDAAVHYRPDHAQSWVERGYTRERQGDIQDALEDYDQAIVLNSQQYFALAQRGALRMRSGDVQAGEADFIQSLALKDDDPGVYRNRGEQYLCLKRYPDAVNDFNEALRLRPGWKEVQAMKAEAERLQANPVSETQTAPKTQEESGCRLS